MEISEILNIVFGGTSVVAVIGWLVYRKQNKRLKDNEVKASDVDTQKQDIDLSDYFKDKMLAMMEQFSEKQQSGNDNQQRILDKLDKVEDKVDGIETYLNGPYHQWLADKERRENEQTSTDTQA